MRGTPPIKRDIQPIPDSQHVGLTTYDAKDPRPGSDLDFLNARVLPRLFSENRDLTPALFRNLRPKTDALNPDVQA